jgi:hypothetical protein
MRHAEADLPTHPPRAGLTLGLLLSLLAGLPFLVARYPQLTDYPSHLARYHVMLDGGRSAWLARYYDFDWIFAGNLGADLLMLPLGHLLGAERAGWLIGFLIPVLTGLGIVAVLRALKRPLGFGPLLAFSAIWSPAMGMGFYNFCLALALALLAFALWVRLEDKSWRWALFMLLGLVVWLCHVSGWGALGILVFGYEWHRGKSWRAFAAPWPLLLPVIPQLLAGGAPGSLNFGAHVASYKLGIWMQALRAQDAMLDLLTLGVLAGAVLLAALMRRIDGRLGWAALIFAVLSLVMPRHFGGGDFADYRLIALALMTGCMAIDWRTSRALVAAALALFLMRLAVTTLAWHDGSQRTERALAVLDRLPQGAHVAGAVLVARDGWRLDSFEHVPSYATVRRDALVNTHFAIRGVHMLQLREGGPGFIDPSHRVFHRRGERIDLSRFPPAARADYLWYVGTRRPDALPPGAVIIAQAPGSLLARLAKPAPAR